VWHENKEFYAQIESVEKVAKSSPKKLLTVSKGKQELFHF
jgi:hypothetical protein